MKRAAIYCRISETDARTPKVEIQEARCRALAEREGFEVQEAHVYADDGISGYRFVDRPDWKRLVAAIPSGAFDVILATEETRFTRQPQEKYAFELTCDASGVTWHTELDGPTDPSTSNGAFSSEIRAAFARQESRRKAERQRAAFDARLSKGEPLWGGRPFGYEVDRKTLRPVEAAQVRWAIETILNGGTIYSIIKRWNGDGLLTARGKPWSYAQVQQVLKRPRNAGLVERRGEILYDVSATWEPIITREQHERLMAILRDPSRAVTRVRDPRWLCAGLALCGRCGAPMRSAGANYKGESFTVYRCSSRMNAVAGGERHAAHRADVLDARVGAAIVSAFLMGPASMVDSVGKAPSDVPVLLERLVALRREKENLVEVAMIGGVDGAVRRQLTALNDEEAAIEARIRARELESARASMFVASRRALFGSGVVHFADAVTASQEIQERFETLSLAERRVLVRELVTVTVHPGRRPDRVLIHHRVVTSLNEEPSVDETGGRRVRRPTPGAPGAAPDDLGA